MWTTDLFSAFWFFLFCSTAPKFHNFAWLFIYVNGARGVGRERERERLHQSACNKGEREREVDVKNKQLHWWSMSEPANIWPSV